MLLMKISFCDKFIQMCLVNLNFIAQQSPAQTELRSEFYFEYNNLPFFLNKQNNAH